MKGLWSKVKNNKCVYINQRSQHQITEKAIPESTEIAILQGIFAHCPIHET